MFDKLTMLTQITIALHCEVSIKSILEWVHVIMHQAPSQNDFRMHPYISCWEASELQNEPRGASSLCSQDLCCNALGSHGRLHPEPVSWCIERLCQEAYKIDVRMHSESMSHNAFMSDCIRMTPTSYQKASGAKPAYISSELMFQFIQTSCRKSLESMTSFIENPRRLNSDESPYPNKPTIHLRMRS